MAWQNPTPLRPAVKSSTDLSAYQYHFVVLDASARAALPPSRGSIVDGVLQDKPLKAGDQAAVATSAQPKVVAGEIIAAGQYVGADTEGRAIVAQIGEWAAGRALSDASLDQFVTVHLHPYGRIEE